MKVSLLVAFDLHKAIGFQNTLPWDAPEELRWVSYVTRKVQDPNKRNAVLMGRKTWESIPRQRRPLHGRLNLVVSSTLIIGQAYSDVEAFRDFESAIEHVNSMPNIETVFLFGGESIYRQGMDSDIVDEILATEINTECHADTYFPPIPVEFHMTSVRHVTLGQLDARRLVYKRSRGR